MLLGTDKSGAEDDIGMPFQDGSNQFWIFLGVILEIRILDHDDGRGRRRNARAQSRALSAIDAVAQKLQARVSLRVFFQYGWCLIQ
jgi:hypothetical protein